MPHHVTENAPSECVCVPIFDCSDARRRDAARAAMRRGEPAVLRNARLLVPGSIPGWNEASDASERPFEAFAASGADDARAWRVMLSSSAEKKRNRFYPLRCVSDRSLENAENGLGAPYRVRRPETSLTRLTAREFARCAETWRERGAYFEDEIARFADERFPGAAAPVDGGDGLGKTVLDAIDWERVRDEIQYPQRLGALRAVLLSAGTRGSVLPFHVPLASGVPGGAAATAKEKTFSRNVFAHAPAADAGALDPPPSRVVPDTHGLEVSAFDVEAQREADEAADEARDDAGFETVQVQLSGRRRVVLVSPEQTYRGLYPFPAAHPLDGRSMVDWSDVDYARFPKAARVRGAVAIVEPGDALFVPEAYWRHEHGLSAAHAHAQLRFARSDPSRLFPEAEGAASSPSSRPYRVPPSLAVGRPRTAAASVFFVGRAVEKLVGKSEGERDARHWLEVCARREETEWLDLSSVAGHRRVDLFRRVRQAVDHGLPPPKVGVDAFRAALRREFEPGNLADVEKDAEKDAGAAKTANATNDETAKRASSASSASSAAPHPPERGVELVGDARVALEAPPRRGEVSVLAAATERETRGAGRHERFLLDLIDGRMCVDDPHPSWVDDDFVDPVLVAEALKTLSETTSSGPSDSTRSGLVAARAADPASLRVALPGGGVLTSRLKRLPDDRTDAERAFPEMFVETLRKKGWSETRHTPVSVLNPEHPDFVGKKPS